MKRWLVTFAFLAAATAACTVEPENPSAGQATGIGGGSTSAAGSGGSSTAGRGGGAGGTGGGGGTAVAGSAGQVGDGGHDGAPDAGDDGDAAGGGPGQDGGADDGAGDASGGDPTLLSQTGLYSNIATGQLAAGVLAYQPQFQLWSDNATKKRWIKLPPGTKIDTSNMNFWVYPPDTKLFKEFTRDGVRVETRLMWKHGAGDWFMIAYKWNASQTEAVAVPNGEMNASSTEHDIPAQEGCTTCHGGMPDRVLGFSAIQLSHNLGDLNLTQASSMGLLTHAPAGSFVVPGDAIDKAALGYLHSNCGLCHNERSKVFLLKVDVDTWLDTTKLATVAETRTFISLVDKANTGTISKVTKRIAPSNPADSAVHELMVLRGDAMRQMPLIGTELVDTAGVAAIDAWIMKPPR